MTNQDKRKSKLLTASEVKEVLNIGSLKTLYTYAKKGWIPSVPFGSRNLRFRYEDIQIIENTGIYPNSCINLDDGNSKRLTPVKTRRRKYEWKR